MPLRWPRSLLAAALAVAGAAALVAGLRLRVSADLAQMLPQGSPAADAYRELLDVFGTFEKIAIAVRLPPGADAPRDRDPLTDAAFVLEEILAASPDVAEVRVGIDETDERFFLDHVLPRAALFLPEDELLARVGAAIDEEALAERAQSLARLVQSPGGELLAPLLVRDPLGFADRLPGVELGAWGVQVDLLTGVFRSADGRAGLAIVTPRGEELDAEMGQRLFALLDQTRERLRREVHPQLEILAVGGPLYAAEDADLIRRDLEGTVGGSVVVCLLMLVVVFGGWRVPAMAGAVIGIALIWTAGAVGLALGDVSALSFGFAAVLIGLGIDYCITGAARVEDRLRAGDATSTALGHAIAITGPAIVVSALGSAAAFGVLIFSSLRPLAQLGALIALGMLAMLLATYAVGAPIALLLMRRSGSAGGSVWRALGSAVDHTVGAVERRPRTVLLAVTLLLVVVAVPGLARLRFDTDLRALRPTGNTTVAAELAIAESFALGFDTATVLASGRSLDEALAVTRRTTAVLRAELGSGATVESPSDWSLGPGETESKLALLAGLPLGEAADRFEQELRRVGLSPRAFAPGLRALRELGAGRDPAAPDDEDVPGFVRDSVHVRPDGSALVAVHARYISSDAAASPSIENLLARAGLPARVASARGVAAELGRLAVRDARRLGVLAAVAVCGLVCLGFRGRFRPTWQALVPVAAGSALTLWTWGLLGLRLDLLSVAVLPILFGIGIDNGLHVVHGAEAAGGGDLGAASRGAGRAMVLTAATNASGFASLVMSSIPSLRRSGVLVAAGVMICLFTTITLLPALGALRVRRSEEAGAERAP